MPIPTPTPVPLSAAAAAAAVSVPSSNHSVLRSLYSPVVSSSRPFPLPSRSVSSNEKSASHDQINSDVRAVLASMLLERTAAHPLPAPVPISPSTSHVHGWPCSCPLARPVAARRTDRPNTRVTPIVSEDDKRLMRVISGVMRSVMAKSRIAAHTNTTADDAAAAATPAAGSVSLPSCVLLMIEHYTRTLMVHMLRDMKHTVTAFKANLQYMNERSRTHTEAETEAHTEQQHTAHKGNKRKRDDNDQSGSASERDDVEAEAAADVGNSAVDMHFCRSSQCLFWPLNHAHRLASPAAHDNPAGLNAMHEDNTQKWRKRVLNRFSHINHIEIKQ